MKKYCFILVALMSLFLVTACSPTENAAGEANVEEPLELNMVVPTGAASYSVMRMIKEETQFETANMTYEILASPDLLSAAVMTEEADIAIVPTNLAATLYNRGVEYQVLGSVVWGTLYVVSTDETIQTWSDLEGQEIHGFGRGLVPDATFRYLLNQHQLDADEDMTMNYLSSAGEVAQMLIAGKASVAVLSEPAVSQVLANNDDAQIILDLQKEWSAATGSEEVGFPQASLIMRKELIHEHPQLVEEIMQAVEESSNWANENPTLLGEYAEKMDETANKNLIVSSIERMNIHFVPAAEAKEAIIAYLTALYSFSPDFVGGQVPDEGFYFTR